MIFFGEIIALCTSIVWTASALFAEVSSKRIGAISLNVLIMFFAFILLNITLLCLTGDPFPQYLDLLSLYWIIGSGIITYVVCNYFLFNAYVMIGSRITQLFMTLVPPTSAFAGWILLKESLTLQEIIGIAVTMTGIIIAVGGRRDKEKEDTRGTVKQGKAAKLSMKGVIFAVIAAVSEGIGLVMGKVGMIHYHNILPEGLTRLDNVIPISTSFIRVLTGFCGFMMIALFSKQLPAIKKAVHDKKGFLTSVMTALTGPFGGATLSLVAMRYSKAGIAATLVELTPIMIILPAYLIFKQKIRVQEIIGPIISIFGVFLFFIRF